MSILLLAVALLAGSVNSSNSTISDGGEVCESSSAGLWSSALEDWATSTLVQSGRHGRVMALPSTKGYYVAERYDTPYLSPPPPYPSQHIPTQGHAQPPPSPGYIPQSQNHPPSSSGYIQQSQNHPPSSPGYIPQNHPPSSPGHISHGPMHNMPPHGMHVPQGYKEWEGTPQSGGGKIVNRPTKPYKDKFKPSYPPPQQEQQHRPGANSIDRVDDPPRKQVTETDLYLLSAIEKLVYRVDHMEKRLRKMEEGVHYLLAGVESKPDPCPKNYTRVGDTCYSWSEVALDWKGASVACRKARAALLELTDDAQRKTLYSRLLSDKQLRGNDFWTGGLNPGLLWIWSHSAKPVEPNATNSTSIAGDGRCLALVSDPTRNTYVYRGQDCAVPHRYICQKEDSKEKLGNEIERVARKLKHERRRSKLLWDDDMQPGSFSVLGISANTN
ncbi:uncharacterized protein [Maniola hyperantus]|uniref:uncharacterized protein n=1 Tax=Aphantopus hyperantus TaxID=2795564 RepID=UPI0015684C37|nr:uncharacterized protein LOC117996979 [Maniola hyperantus]